MRSRGDIDCATPPLGDHAVFNRDWSRSGSRLLLVKHITFGLQLLHVHDSLGAQSLVIRFLSASSRRKEAKSLSRGGLP